jgi:hypothetical protein
MSGRLRKGKHSQQHPGKRALGGYTLTGNTVQQPILGTEQGSGTNDGGVSTECITNTSFAFVFCAVELGGRVGRSVQVGDVDESGNTDVS